MKKRITPKTISAEEFDQLADSGSEEIEQYLDWKNASRPGLEVKRTTLDLPAHVLQKLDREAALRGVTRQSLLKMWIYERVEQRES
jgi:hypothetical protein